MEFSIFLHSLITAIVTDLTNSHFDVNLLDYFTRLCKYKLVKA